MPDVDVAVVAPAPLLGCPVVAVADGVVGVVPVAAAAAGVASGVDTNSSAAAVTSTRAAPWGRARPGSGRTVRPRNVAAAAQHAEQHHGVPPLDESLDYRPAPEGTLPA